MIPKRLIRILCVSLLLLGVVSISGCAVRKPVKETDKTESKDTGDDKKDREDKEETDKEKADKEKADKGKDDDVIVAGSVDTSSKFSFSVTDAIVGVTDADEPVVVLAGTFTNDSDETIAFSWALEATATQSGYTLPNAYLSGASTFNYNEIAPGKTIPVYIGWKVADTENDITLSVRDMQHYAKEEIYSQTFTVDELIQNTKDYQDSDGIIDEPL